MRVLAAMALAVALVGCTMQPEGMLSILFDQPMVPEDVGATLLRCGVHHDPVENSTTVWSVPPDLSQKQLACLRRQPHVEAVRGAL